MTQRLKYIFVGGNHWVMKDYALRHKIEVADCTLIGNSRWDWDKINGIEGPLRNEASPFILIQLAQFVVEPELWDRLLARGFEASGVHHA